ncbi:MAG: PAS domain S-box-containing protein [Gammaproteobacteria bacterium]|jgi:PAS domain S-box-containing protein
MIGMFRPFNRRALQIFSFICMFLVSGVLFGSSGHMLDLANLSQRDKPTHFIGYFEDFSGQLSINDIASPPFENKFIPLNGDSSLGFSQSVIWSRLMLNNNSDQGVWYLRFSYTATEQLSLFLAKESGGFTEQTRSFYDDFSTRNIPDRFMSFHLQVPAGEQKIVYMRHDTKSTINYRSQILSESEWVKTVIEETMYHSLFYGALVVVFIASLILAMRTRLVQYLYIVVASIGLVIAYGLFDGYIQIMFGIVTGRFTLFPLGLFATGCAIIGMLSYQRYLLPELRQKKSYRYSYTLICRFWIVFSALSLHSRSLSIEPALFVFGYLFSAIYTVVCVVIYTLGGNRKKRYLLISFGLLAFGCLIQGAYSLGLIEYDVLKFDVLRIGIVALVVSMLASLLDNKRQLQKQLDHIHRAASALSNHRGDAFFKELSLRLAEISQCDYIIIGHCEDGDLKKLSTVAYCAHGKLIDNTCPTILGNSGLSIFNSNSCVYVDKVQECFPEDDFLAKQNVCGYLGKALVDSKGHLIGLIAVFDSMSIDYDHMESLLGIFSTSAAMELERVRAAKFLEESLQKLGYASLVADVTSEKELVSALQRNQCEELGILNAMVDAVISIDEHGRILTFNRSAETLFGCASDEVIGDNVQLLMSDATAGRHCDDAGDFVRDFTRDDIKIDEAAIIENSREVEGKHKNGECLPLGISIFELPDSRDSSCRFIVTCRDLTAVKDQERQLRHSQKMDTLGKLAGGIAHDFNNLLGIISGYSSLLSGLLLNEALAEKYLEKIGDASDRAIQLTKMLLSLSKKSSLDTQVVELNSILIDMKPLVARALTSRIKIDIHVDERIKPVTIHVGHLEDTVMNLCLNAMQAIDGDGEVYINTKAGITVDVIQANIHSVKSGTYASLTVRDSGCGIEESDLIKIFDPLYSSKDDHGSGLGLSLVQSFITQSGGFIEVVSEVGDGTSFSLYFPQD